MQIDMERRVAAICDKSVDSKDADRRLRRAFRHMSIESFWMMSCYWRKFGVRWGKTAAYARNRKQA